MKNRAHHRTKDIKITMQGRYHCSCGIIFCRNYACYGEYASEKEMKEMSKEKLRENFCPKCNKRVTSKRIVEVF